MPVQTLAMETYGRRAFNYLDRMIDRDGLPYFNVFWTHPVEAAHDWPDFGDVLSRQLQGAVMARYMTGQEAAWEKKWIVKLLGYQDPVSGLLRRPKTSHSASVTDPGDQALTLYALVTVYLDGGDAAIKNAIRKIISGRTAAPDRARMLSISFGRTLSIGADEGKESDKGTHG